MQDINSNRVYRRSAYLPLGVLALALAACGGGGGETENTLVTPPDTGGSPPPADTVAPTIAITSPDDDGNAIIAGSSVTLAGQASDNVAVQSISWRNNRGGQGTVSVGSSWQTPEIALQSGNNLITVEAEDAAGNRSTDDITIVQQSMSGTSSESVAMISYGADLTNATMLQNADVQRRAAYLYFDASDEWNDRGVLRIDFYCCKALTGPSENHQPRVIVNAEPFVFSIDLGQFVGGNQRELYADVYFQDGGVDNVYVQFNLEADGSSGGSNTAPTISGAPSTQVTAGQAYTFTPSANDADGDGLTFSIQNRPSWADFSIQTGRLSGTPSAADGGDYNNIIISVTDGLDSASLAPFAINVNAVSDRSLTINWNPPTQNVDGSAIVGLSGFKIFYGQTPGNYPNVINVNDGGLTSYTIDNLLPGTWYLAMTATATNGLESALSYEISRVAQ